VHDEDVVSDGGSIHVQVMLNDDDPTGEPLHVADATTPAHGTVSCSSSGDCLYTPAPGFAGTDSFRYDVCNSSRECTWGTASVRVLGLKLQRTGTEDRTLVGIALLFLIAGATELRASRAQIADG
jgi:hypothetical protein